MIELVDATATLSDISQVIELYRAPRSSTRSGLTKSRHSGLRAITWRAATTGISRSRRKLCPSCHRCSSCHRRLTGSAACTSQFARHTNDAVVRHVEASSYRTSINGYSSIFLQEREHQASHHVHHRDLKEPPPIFIRSHRQGRALGWELAVALPNLQ
jgi:hypothetical protein